MDHCYLCLVIVMLSRRFIAAPFSPTENGLTSWLALFCGVYCVFVNCPCGELGRMWYLILSFPHLCRLSYLIYTHRIFSEITILQSIQNDVVVNYNDVTRIAHCALSIE